MSVHPWIASYPAPARWDAPIEVGPVYAVLDGTAARFPDRPAIEFMGKHATYREFFELTNRAAKGFAALGVRPGVHVGLYLPNTPQYLIAFFGVLKAGGTVVNYSPLDAEQVLAHKAEDSETQIIVTLDSPAMLPQMQALVGHARVRQLVTSDLAADMALFPQLRAAPANGTRASSEGARLSFLQLLDNDGVFEPVPIGDPTEAIAVIQYTGGTTGLPKGAMLTHANLTAACSQYYETTKVTPPLLLEGRESTLLVLPLFHIYALTSVMLLCIRYGAELVLHLRFDAEAIAQDLAAKKITIFMGVPTMYAALIAYPEIGKLDLSALKYSASGGAPLPLEIAKRYQALTGSAICEGWGMTETSPSGTFSPVRGVRKEGSCGIPVPGVDIKCAAVGDPETYVALGQPGEICLKGPNVMKGYWKNPAATAESMTADGYLRTGDVAYMDEDGYLFIVDRIKDMLLCGGFNVYPRNIEEAIYKHPDVAEVSVIGVPDAYRGESPKAFIALKKGRERFSLEHLKEFLKDKLGKHEMVHLIEFREQLPKSPVGKILKTALHEEEKKARLQTSAGAS